MSSGNVGVIPSREETRKETRNTAKKKKKKKKKKQNIGVAKGRKVRLATAIDTFEESKDETRFYH
jgi:hypothetical protein